MEDDPLFRRTRQHAEKRLVFHSGQSDTARLQDIKEFVRLEKEMLQRYHLKGDSGLRLTRARSIIIDVLIQNLFPMLCVLQKKAWLELSQCVCLQPEGMAVANLTHIATLTSCFSIPEVQWGNLWIY